jgi:hypothetical protein
VATATSRRAFSPLRAFLAALVLLPALPAWALQVDLSLADLRHPAFEASGIRVRFDAVRPGAAEIRIEKLALAGIEYRALRLTCEGFRFDGRRLDCPAGTLRREDERGRTRPPLPFAFAWRDDGFLDFSLKDAEPLALSPLVKRLRGWNPSGRVDLHLQMAGGQRDTARLELEVRDLAFASRDGATAGSAISLDLVADARRTAGGWQWDARIDWPQGEFRMKPWRFPSGMRIAASGSLTQEILDVDQARLEVDAVGAVTAGLRWERGRGRLQRWGLVSEPLDLAAAMRAWLQPWLAGLGFPQWNSSGKVLFSAEGGEEGLQRFFASLQGAALSDGTGYLALDGIDAYIPWEADAATEAEIAVASGRFGELPLGAFRIPLRLEGASARIDNLVAPLLDGRFAVENLSLRREAKRWSAEFSGSIEGVSMPKLSRALKLPAMAGTLSAHVPRIAYADAVLRMDGALGIEVFDGGIIVHRLRMHDPFSAQRRLLMDVTARGLDLGMLTRTFAFGSIEGRFDADLHDLEMAGWKPLRFDARIASVEGDHPRVLSLGALKDITALGQPGEGAALGRLPERSGIGLNYRRIGIGCRLRDGVCDLSGIPGRDEAERVVLMEGSGIPSIDIIGYNRRIAWDALVARFREILAGRPALVID